MIHYAPHNKNFQNYITAYANRNRVTMAGPVWEAALAAAQRLDYVGDRSGAPKMKLTPSPPPSPLAPVPPRSDGGLLGRLFTRLLRRTPPPAPEPEQPAPPAHLTELDDIQAFLRLAPKAAAQQSQINWGSLKNGFASRVVARLRRGGQQKGSTPTPHKMPDAPLWKQLHRRKLADGKKTLYARGHLLHLEAGGPGVDYNLVALTAAARGDFRANHANFVHRYSVEAVILGAYDKMYGEKATITEIYYEVVADYNRQPRPETEELRKIAKAYKKTADRIRTKSVVDGDSGGTEPKHEHIINKLVLALPSPHLDDAMLAIAAEAQENWDEVHRRIVKNLELWQFEDEHVPLALHLTYYWVDASRGVATQPRTVTIDIHLPNSLAARFK